MQSHNQLIARLARAFPREQVEAGTLRVYLEELADVPGELLADVVQELIRTSKWFPTIHEIRCRAAERVLALPAEAEALAQVGARMRWARDGQRGDPPAVHALVREALEQVGGYYAFRAAENAGVVRGQFGRLYREMRAEAVRDAQAGAQSLSAGEPTRRALPQPKETG